MWERQQGDRICAPRSPAGEIGEGLAELWDERCLPVGGEWAERSEGLV